jgi:hypothetical protein
MSRTGLAPILSTTMTTGASKLMVPGMGQQALGFAIRWFKNLARRLAGWNVSWRVRREANKALTRLHAPSFPAFAAEGHPNERAPSTDRRTV